jgi:3-hydroxybutyryl-CoA dehydrogenase
MKTIGVIGAGQMGLGIAQVCAGKGFLVVLCDAKKESLDKARQVITQSAEKLLAKNLLSPGEEQSIRKIVYTEKKDDLRGSDLLIEAVPEDEELKKNILSSLEPLLSQGGFLASNTSSLSITRLGRVLKDPGRFLGIHFMNPVPLMKLVEVIPGLETRPDVLAQGLDFVRSLQKDPVTSKDYPGFIVNRILMPMINEAFFAMMETLAEPSEIDQAMVLGCHQPMGPLALADFIGLDTCLSIMKVLHSGLGDSKYRPCPLLQQYVDSGRLGRKSGRGVYVY